MTGARACNLAGYGLGKSDWVNVRFAAADCPPVDVLKEWVEDSYRLIAPKKLGQGTRRLAPVGRPT